MKTNKTVYGFGVVGMAAGLLLILTTANVVHAGTIVLEGFGGDDSNLNSTAADTFSSAITSAGGSGTWVAGGTTFQQDGDVVNNGGSFMAYLSLGTYIGDAMGTAAGLFELSATLAPTTGTWVSLGFFKSATPNKNTNFTGDNGMATMIYRASGEVDAWAGPVTAHGVQGSMGLSGDQLFTIELDFTPTGGYNGTDNFGTVSFYEGTSIPANSIGSYTYTSAQSFGSLGMSEVSTSTGTVSDLELTQVLEPASMVLMLLGTVGLLVLRRRE